MRVAVSCHLVVTKLIYLNRVPPVLSTRVPDVLSKIRPGEERKKREKGRRDEICSWDEVPGKWLGKRERASGLGRFCRFG